MEDKPKDPNEYLREHYVDSIETSASDITVSVSSLDKNVEYSFPQYVTIDNIASTSAISVVSDFGVPKENEIEVRRVVKEAVEEISVPKKFISEIGFELSKEGIKFNIKREPQNKIVRRFHSEEEAKTSDFDKEA